MPKGLRFGSHISWTTKRRGDKWLAVVYIGEAPATLGAYDSKQEARAVARKRAASFRV